MADCHFVVVSSMDLLFTISANVFFPTVALSNAPALFNKADSSLSRNPVITTLLFCRGWGVAEGEIGWFVEGWDG